MISLVIDLAVLSRMWFSKASFYRASIEKRKRREKGQVHEQRCLVGITEGIHNDIEILFGSFIYYLRGRWTKTNAFCQNGPP